MNDIEKKAIKEAEKRTERRKSERQREEIRRVLNSKTFQDLDYPEDEEESDFYQKDF